MGWVTYNYFYYTANLITKSLSSFTLQRVLLATNMKDEWWKKIGIEIRKMHDLNIYHGDLNITNIMIDKETGSISILDFDKSCFRKIKKHHIQSNLKRLKRSLIKMNFYNKLHYKKIIDGYKSISE